MTRPSTDADECTSTQLVDAFDVACRASRASRDEARHALIDQLSLLKERFPGEARARDRAAVRALLVGTTKAITGLHTTSKQLDLSALSMRDALLREHAALRAQRTHLETQTASLARLLSDAEAQHEVALREAMALLVAAEARHSEAEVRFVFSSSLSLCVCPSLSISYSPSFSSSQTTLLPPQFRRKPKSCAWPI